MHQVRGWWNASKALVLEGRRHKIDLTTPVRRSVAEVKQQAEELLRWLEPSYAFPAPIDMAFQWVLWHSRKLERKGQRGRLNAFRHGETYSSVY